MFSSERIFAGFGLELSRDFSETAQSNNAMLVYNFKLFEDQDSEGVGLFNNFKYAYSGMTSKVNLNAYLQEIEINSKSHGLVYEATINDKLTLALKYTWTNFNEDEALQKASSAGLYYEIDIFQIGYSAESMKISQNTDVIIFNTNYKNDIYYNQNSNSYFLAIQWSYNFMTSLNYTEYTYDKNLNTSYAILTTVPFLNRAGGSIASEISGSLKNSLDFNISYLATDKWLFNFGLGTSVDYLDPSAKANNLNFGVDYEFEVNKIYYRGFALTDFSKSVEKDDVAQSGEIGLGASF